MKSLQEIFNDLQDLKKQQRELRQAYRDSLTNSEQYQEIVDQIQTFKEQKKTIEAELKKDFPQLERVKKEIEDNSQMLSDVALNSLVKGEAIEVIDEYKNQYEPIVKVSFKKIK